jgi:DNA-directed RNA polymerase subunit RPC12/RpoP
MQTKTECSRCGAEIDEQENFSVGEQDFCENCHDDLFVSWNDKLKETK